jgi:hypothetical protein
MHKRAAVLIMILFLLAGIVSSAACEMMCQPSNQTAACCPHPIRHCAKTVSIASAQQCGPPQEETAIASTVVQSSQLQATTSAMLLMVPHASVIAAAQHVSLRDSVNRPSFIPPLRI